QERDVGHDAEGEARLAAAAITGALDEQSGRVVDGDGEEQDQDVGRDKSHVEVATGGQQQHPASPLGEQEVERGDDQEEQEEEEGIEQHGGTGDCRSSGVVRYQSSVVARGNALRALGLSVTGTTGHAAGVESLRILGARIWWSRRVYSAAPSGLRWTGSAKYLLGRRT